MENSPGAAGTARGQTTRKPWLAAISASGGSINYPFRDPPAPYHPTTGGMLPWCVPPRSLTCPGGSQFHPTR